MNAVKQAENGEYRLSIVQDDVCSSPREDGNCGKMVCWHRKYSLGDKHGYSTPQEFLADIDKEHCVILPLYLYDHSGITMSTTPFSCPWDSGQVGFIYMTYDEIRKNFGVSRVTPSVIAKVRDSLVAEVVVYDQYLRGDVYGFIIEKKHVWKDFGGVEMSTWDNIDSCYGFYGSDIKENGMLDNIGQEYINLFSQLA